MWVDDDHPVELEPLHRFGSEQRDVVVAEFVHVVDRDETEVAQRTRRSTRATPAERRRRQPVTMLRPRRRSCATVVPGELRRRRRARTAHSRSGRTARLAVASTPVNGSRRLATVEDRLGNAVADRQIGDGAVEPAPAAPRWANTSTHRSWPAGVVDWATSPTSVSDPAGTAPADHPQRHRGLILRLVDDHVGVGERRPVEQRVGLVDEELVGGASTPRRLPRGPGR